jgi:hypothetical protein
MTTTTIDTIIIAIGEARRSGRAIQAMHPAGSTDIPCSRLLAFLGCPRQSWPKRSYVMKADTRRQLKVVVWGAIGAFMVLAAIYVAF